MLILCHFLKGVLGNLLEFPGSLGMLLLSLCSSSLMGGGLEKGSGRLLARHSLTALIQ